MAWTRTDFQRPPSLIVDCDGHLNDNHVEWEKRLPRKYEAWAPKYDLVGGKRGYRPRAIEGKPFEAGKYLMSDKQKGLDMGVRKDPSRWSAIWSNREGEVNPQARLADMDYEGLDIACCFGSASLNGVLAIDDAEFAAAFARAYNDWCIGEYCAVDPYRLRFPAVLPLQDPKLAVEEVYHAKKIGAVGVQVWPHFRRIRLHDPRFDPVWTAAEECDLPVCVHAANWMGYGPESEEIRFFKHSFMSYDMMMACASFTGYGILEKHPKLRVGFMEAMASWAIFCADRFDEHWSLWPHELPWQSRSPGDWIRSENCYFSAQAIERSIPQFMTAVSPNNVMFNTDYSHGDGASPDGVKLIYTRTDMTEVQKRKVLGENAARFYKIAPRKTP